MKRRGNQKREKKVDTCNKMKMDEDCLQPKNISAFTIYTFIHPLHKISSLNVHLYFL